MSEVFFLYRLGDVDIFLMPPKTRSQPDENTGSDVDQSGMELDPEERVPSTMVPGAGADGAITALAQMFKSFMEYQKDRDDRQERETVRREQHFKVLSHQRLADAT